MRVLDSAASGKCVITLILFVHLIMRICGYMEHAYIAWNQRWDVSVVGGGWLGVGLCVAAQVALAVVARCWTEAGCRCSKWTSLVVV